MTEKLEDVEIEYTHTYDEFTVFFYGDRVFIGKSDYTIRQCCVDMMNVSVKISHTLPRLSGNEKIQYSVV